MIRDVAASSVDCQNTASSVFPAAASCGRDDIVPLTLSWVGLVHVVPPSVDLRLAAVSGSTDPSQVEEARALAERDLAGVAARLRQRGVRVKTRVEVGASVAGVLTELVNTGPHDMIAVTTHARGGLQRVILGSVADKVIRGSDKPVLVVHPAG